jgi:hypothetical protein
MSQSSFGEALSRLWPSHDARIAGLGARIITAAPAVVAKYRISTPLLIAHVMAQISHECGGRPRRGRFSPAAQLGSRTLYPSTDLNGWYIAP